jgi:hypothetical protein
MEREISWEMQNDASLSGVPMRCHEALMQIIPNILR